MARMYSGPFLCKASKKNKYISSSLKTFFRNPKSEIRNPKSEFRYSKLYSTFAAMIELSLVIPVMNEEDNIKPLLEAVKAALSGLEYEVILVDDGSTDSTRKRIL